jgi:prepilin-type processing-associated H-X9-DG protein
MGVGLVMYTNETKFYPGDIAQTSKQIIVNVWAPAIRIYMKGNQGVFWCPARDPDLQWTRVYDNPAAPSAASDSETGFGYLLKERMLCAEGLPAQFIKDFSYGYNDWGSFPGPAGATDPAYPGDPPQLGLGLGGDVYFGTTGGSSAYNFGHIRASRVSHISETIAIADRGVGTNRYRYNIDPTTSTEYPGNVHRNGANVLFCDGHVGWYLQADLTNVSNTSTRPGWQQMRRMWNRDHQIH